MKKKFYFMAIMLVSFQLRTDDTVEQERVLKEVKKLEELLQTTDVMTLSDYNKKVDAFLRTCKDKSHYQTYRERQGIKSNDFNEIKQGSRVAGKRQDVRDQQCDLFAMLLAELYDAKRAAKLSDGEKRAG